MFNKILFKIWRLVLPIIFIFFLIHFLKDITQDILRIATPLDIFGDAQEDLSSFPPIFRTIFWYVLGPLSFLGELYLLITIPKIYKNKLFTKQEAYILAVIIGLFVYLIACILLDPRFTLR